MPRLLRMFRPVKPDRYTGSVGRLERVREGEEPLVTPFVGPIPLAISSSPAYFVEDGNQPGEFSGIPAGGGR